MSLLRIFGLLEGVDRHSEMTDEAYHLRLCARMKQVLRKGESRTLRPHVPRDLEPGEDDTTPRVSFCRKIEECLEVLPQGLEAGEHFYVFKPSRPIQLYVTDLADEMDPDNREFRSGVGGRQYYDQPWDELWSLEPVQCTVMGIYEYLEDGSYREVAEARPGFSANRMKRPPSMED